MGKERDKRFQNPGCTQREQAEFVGSDEREQSVFIQQSRHAAFDQDQRLVDNPTNCALNTPRSPFLINGHVSSTTVNLW